MLLLLTALSLAGCRTRRVEGVGGASGQAEQGARAESVQAVSPSESWPEATAESEPDPSADTRENPAADRRNTTKTPTWTSSKGQIAPFTAREKGTARRSLPGTAA